MPSSQNSKHDIDTSGGFKQKKLWALKDSKCVWNRQWRALGWLIAPLPPLSQSDWCLCAVLHTHMHADVLQFKLSKHWMMFLSYSQKSTHLDTLMFLHCCHKPQQPQHLLGIMSSKNIITKSSLRRTYIHMIESATLSVQGISCSDVQMSKYHSLHP